MIENYIGLSEIQVSDEIYTIEKLVRSSRISDVYHVKQKETELEYILKVLSPKEEDSEGNIVPLQKGSSKYEEYKSDFIQEVRISRKVSENFSEIFGNEESYVFYDFVDENNAFLLLKYFPMDTLEKYIENFKGDNKIHKKENIIFLLVRCVYKLHKLGILHGDISPDNILVGEGGDKVVLIDYGNVLTNQRKLFFYKKIYSAPELDKQPNCFGKYTDIYSLGMVIKYILTGTSLRDMYYYWLLKGCLQRHPKKRFQSCAIIYITLYLHKYRKKILIMTLLMFLLYIINFEKGEQKNQEYISDIYTTESIVYNDNKQFEYEIVNNKAYITGSPESITDIVIPEEIDGIPVIAIQGINKNVTNLIISEGIERIDDYAFQNCQYLQSIQIPESVSYISEYAFINCNQLAKIEISSENRFYELYNNKLLQKSDDKVIYIIDSEKY